MLFGRRVGAQQAAGYISSPLRSVSGWPATSTRLLRSSTTPTTGSMPWMTATEGVRPLQHGHALRWVGRYEEADAYLRQSESIRRDLRDQRALAISLEAPALNGRRGRGRSARAPWDVRHSP